MIKCQPLIAFYYFCIECDKIRPFNGDSHCFICGCDCPFGELNDYSISQEEWDSENKRSIEKIGDMRELPKDHWIHDQ